MDGILWYSQHFTTIVHRPSSDTTGPELSPEAGGIWRVRVWAVWVDVPYVPLCLQVTRIYFAILSFEFSEFPIRIRSMKACNKYYTTSNLTGYGHLVSCDQRHVASVMWPLSCHIHSPAAALDQTLRELCGSAMSTYVNHWNQRAVLIMF